MKDFAHIIHPCATLFSIFPPLIIFICVICSDPSAQSSLEFLGWNHAPRFTMCFLSEYLPHVLIAYLFVITVVMPQMSIFSCDIVIYNKNMYLIFVPIPGTELWKLLEFLYQEQSKRLCPGWWTMENLQPVKSLSGKLDLRLVSEDREGEGSVLQDQVLNLWDPVDSISIELVTW